MAPQTWFITGVNSGFGRELSEALLRRGDRVAGTVRKADSVADLAREFGDRFWTAHLDVTDGEEITRVVDRAFTELDRIDVVVSNAGYGLFGAAEEVSDDQILHVLNTNLVGSIRVGRAVLPHLRAQGGGRIIQLSSVAGQTAAPGASLYQASKWGIEAFMEALSHEVAGFGIGVTLVEPGGARTDFQSGSLRLGRPLAAYDNTAAAMVRNLQKPEFRPAGDPKRMAAAIIDSVEQHPAPLRLVLGRSAYDGIRAALTERLADIEPQQELAYSADFPE
ncbi:SDR family oxidoreductase [Amycolatopsis ultiminotia]|uniref:SDR family oxidoreductase n=1 Tax=Amycolatopsis ultiminotia TaxID=543629 RepID=A0ABP6VGY7_9PSEU